MAGFIKYARIAFIGDDKQYKAALRRVERETQRTVRNLNKVGAQASKIFLGAAATSGGLIKLYSDQEQAERGVAAAIRQMGREHELSTEFVKSYANEIQKSSRFGDEAAIAASTLAIRLGDLNKEQLPRAISLFGDVATAMGRDLVGVSRQLSKALADPAKGVTALADAGINLDESTRLWIKGMAESGDKVGAQNALLHELKKAYGGSSAAALEGTGIIIATKNALGDLGEAIGKILFEWIQPFVKWIKETAERMKENESAVQALATALKALLIFSVVAKAATVFAAAVVALKAKVIILTRAMLAARIGAALMWGAITGGITIVLSFLPEIIKFFQDDLPTAFEKVKIKGELFWLGMKEGAAQAKFAVLDLLSAVGLASDGMVSAAKTALEEIGKEIQEAENREADIGKSGGKDERVEQVKAYVKERQRIIDEAEAEEQEKAKQAAKDKRDREEAERLRKIAEEKARREEQRQFELSQKQEQAKIDAEVLRKKLAGEEEIDIEFYERQRQLELERRELERIEDEELREQELENNRLQQELLQKQRDDAAAAKIRARQVELEEEHKANQKAAKANQKALTNNLLALLGTESKIGKAAFAAMKAIEIAELITATEANAAQAFTNAMAAYPPPANLAIAKTMYTTTKTAGYLGAAAAAASAIKGLGGGKQDGGVIGGNPLLGDAYGHTLQAGEVVVPRGNYQDLVAGIREQSRQEEGSEGGGSNLMISFDGDAGNYLRATLDGNDVLGV